MEKSTLASLTALLLGASGLAQADATPLETLPHSPVLSEKAPKPNTGKGFEPKAPWGMSAKTLMGTYTDVKVGADGNYAMDAEVGGYPALVIFYLADHFGLARVLVLFKDSIATAPDALRIFNEVEAKLKKQYGLPTQSYEMWRVRPRKITDGAREQSIATGGLQITSAWAGARTWVMLNVGKRPNQERPGTTITYISTDGPLKKEWLEPSEPQAAAPGEQAPQ
jgi:hypothetical protein